MKNVATLLLVGLTGTGLAAAAITPIGQFAGTYSEGFETHPLGQFVPHLDVFGGNGDVWQVGGSQGLHVTTGWVYYFQTSPYAGSRFMGGTSQVTARWQFDVPASKFGGQFTTNYQSSGATATFYDKNMNVLGTAPMKVEAGNNTWGWEGWSIDPPAWYVDIASNYNAGHVMHDEIQYTPIPEPAALSLLALGLLLRRR